MTSERTIYTGGGNYHENVEGDYIQQQGSFGVGVNKGEIKVAQIAENIDEAQQKKLKEIAIEIQALLEQLEKSYPIDTTIGKMRVATEIVERIDGHPTLAVRVLSALKIGSFKAFEQLLSHPAASFLIGALEDWKKTKEV